MIDAVETIAADTALEPKVWSRINRGFQRHLAMKTGIEDCDLRDCTEKILDGFDAFKFGSNVQRRKLGHFCDLCPHLGSNRNGILEMRTAVNDAMYHSAD